MKTENFIYYVVQTHMSYGWDNVWHDGGEDRSDALCFKTLALAKDELDEYLNDMSQAVRHGHIDTYTKHDYRIVKVTEEVVR